MILTKWKLISPSAGVCKLVSFSSAFSAMIGHPQEYLSNCFTCAQLYPRRILAKTSQYYSLISSGRVESFAMKNLVLRTGHIPVEALFMVSMEFDEDNSVTVSVCMEEFDNLSIFNHYDYCQPFWIKLFPETSHPYPRKQQQLPRQPQQQQQQQPQHQLPVRVSPPPTPVPPQPARIQDPVVPQLFQNRWESSPSNSWESKREFPILPNQPVQTNSTLFNDGFSFESNDLLNENSKLFQKDSWIDVNSQFARGYYYCT